MAHIVDEEPETEKIMPSLVEIVKKLNVAVANKNVLSKEERGNIKQALGYAVEHADVNLVTLKSTGLGKAVKKLSKHVDPKVNKWATKLMVVFIEKFAPTSSAEVKEEKEVKAEVQAEVQAEVKAEVQVDVASEVLTSQVPSAEAPSAEAPSAEAPSAEAPSVEAPSAEAPSAEAPAAEPPAAEAPAAEAPAAEAPAAEAPAPE